MQLSLVIGNSDVDIGLFSAPQMEGLIPSEGDSPSHNSIIAVAYSVKST